MKNTPLEVIYCDSNLCSEVKIPRLVCDIMHAVQCIKCHVEEYVLIIIWMEEYTILSKFWDTPNH